MFSGGKHEGESLLFRNKKRMYSFYPPSQQSIGPMHISGNRPFIQLARALNAAPGIKVFLLLFLQKKKICSF
jgi:hypothetical protein